MPGIALAIIVMLLAFLPNDASAHAEPDHASPPINGAVPTAPPTLEIWFSEETTAETTIEVIGPGGQRVDLGNLKLDLFDPQRAHVTLSLQPNLGPGTYTVQWHSISGADGDPDQGNYVFSIGDATPGASPVSGGTPISTETEALLPAVSSTLAADQVDSVNFDSKAFAISAGVGILAAAGLFLFWRMVRPRNPIF